MLSEQSCNLASCCLRPMRRNSVFEELRVKRLAVMTSRKKSDEERSEGKQCLSQDPVDRRKRKVPADIMHGSINSRPMNR